MLKTNARKITAAGVAGSSSSLRRRLLFVFQRVESGGECEGHVSVCRGGRHPLGQHEGQQRPDCLHQLGPERQVSADESVFELSLMKLELFNVVF